jgi:cytochrome c oxidase assembly protein subunit 11
MQTKPSSNAQHRRHRAVALWCALAAAGMVGASYAAVPLYRIFCQATGYDGTPRVATKPSSTVLDRTIVVRFDTNVAPGMPWRFEPVKKTMTVKIGENALAFFRAKNLSDHTVHGSATFNVFPEQAAVFFNKVQCFCFTEQVLEAGESVEMPVSFFIDPQIVADKDAGSTTHLTLSYTFFPVKPKPGLASPGPDAARPGSGGTGTPERRSNNRAG